MTMRPVGWLSFLGLAVGLVGPGHLVGQTVVIEGTVRDTVSGRPVPFAVVRVVETGQSTLAGRRGRYRVTVAPAASYTVEVRKIGYRMRAMTVAATSDRSRDIMMTALPVTLEGITVTARADDPAVAIMRRAIARQQALRDRIHDYRYDAYVKFLVRDLDRHRDSVESVFLITETQTEAYWTQPDRYQEVIRARRQSSNLNPEDNLVSVGQIADFSRDQIDLEKYAVPSPTAPDAFDHYRFAMLDTLRVEGRTVFRIAIEPRSEARPLFAGMVDVADSTFDVLSIDVGANEAIRFDFLENLRYRQRLVDWGDDRWMPIEIVFSGEVHFGIPLPWLPEHMQFEHVVTLGNFRFDTGAPPPELGEYLMVVDPDADEPDSTRWATVRPAPLSPLEASAYARIDSLETLPTSWSDILVGGFIGALALAGNQDFFRFNRVDGAYLGAGTTVRQLSPDLVLRSRLGYALGRKAWQGQVGVQYRLWERRRLWVGARYADETTARPTAVSPSRNFTFPILVSKDDPLDYYRHRGVAAFISAKVTSQVQAQLQYTDERQTSLPVVADFAIIEPNAVQRDNPAVVPGRMRSVSASLTFDSRPRLKSKGRDYFFQSLALTQITLGVEVAAPAFIPNDFEFTRAFLRVHHRQRTFNLGLTTFDGALARSWGDLPPQRYFTIDYGDALFFEGQGFNTVDENNFSGNRLAYLFVHHRFDQQLFRRSGIPGIRSLPFTLSVHGGAFWTAFQDHRPNPGDDLVRRATTAYAELGFGVGNLTPWIAPFNFGVWFTWQLSGYDTERFAFSLGIPGQ